ncbi:MAG: alanine racemase [Acidobacteriota bacterium]
MSPSPGELHRPTWAEIDLDALADNLALVRGRVGSRPILAVVKADAYGHGAVRVALALQEQGIDLLGVALPEEGVELRAAGVRCPILVLGGFAPPQADLLLIHDLTPAIYRPDQVASLRAAAERRGVVAAAHLKIDTGMGRLGVPAGALPSFLPVLQAASGRVRLSGAFSHLAVADDPDDPFTRAQLVLFEEALEELGRAGLRPDLVHIANSAAVMDHRPAWMSLVRPGIMLYGYPPSERMTPLPLRPVLSLRARIIYIKDVPPGASLGYGRTWIAPRPSRIASLPLGYDDGLPRLLGNRGHVLVRGRPAPIVGRISMDLTTVDVTGIPEAALGDEAILIGASGQARLGADQLAAWAETIHWEVLCGIGPRVPRLYRRGREQIFVSRFATILAGECDGRYDERAR